MAEAPATQPSLLIRLGDKQDTVAWAQFVEVYAPLVYGFARKHGMQDADAADLTQEVMRAVADRVVEGGRLLDVPEGDGRLTAAQGRQPQRLVGLQRQAGVAQGAGERQQLAGKLLGLGQFGADLVKQPQTPEHGERRCGIGGLRAQFPRPAVSLVCGRGRIALGYLEL